MLHLKGHGEAFCRKSLEGVSTFSALYQSKLKPLILCTFCFLSNMTSHVFVFLHFKRERKREADMETTVYSWFNTCFMSVPQHYT